MSRLVRTQVYLQEDQLWQIKIMAGQEGISQAAALRKVLADGLKKKKLRKVKPLEGLVRLRLKGKPRKGYEGLDSSNMYDYLYGEKSEYGR